MKGCVASVLITVGLIALFVLGLVAQTPLLAIPAFLAWTPAMIYLGWSLHHVRIQIAFGPEPPARQSPPIRPLAAQRVPVAEKL